MAPKKALQKYYKKQLKIQLKSSNFGDGLAQFIIFLQKLRDLILINRPNLFSLKDDPIVSTLCYAINEYYEYKTCITKYFTETGQIKFSEDISRSTVLQKYNEERQIHWAIFWQIVQEYFEDWINLNEFRI